MHQQTSRNHLIEWHTEYFLESLKLKFSAFCSTLQFNKVLDILKILNVQRMEFLCANIYSLHRVWRLICKFWNCKCLPKIKVASNSSNPCMFRVIAESNSKRKTHPMVVMLVCGHNK